MPDLARSTSEMLEEMKKIVQQPEGNTSCAKHRQNVASAITTLIKEQITDAPVGGRVPQVSERSRLAKRESR